MEGRSLVYTPDGCGGWNVTGCGGTPCPTRLPEVALLLAAKSGPDVRFSWSALPAARDGFNLWRVATKTALPILSSPPGPGVTIVCPLAVATTCDHTGGIAGAPGTIAYYQTKGVCGGAEGP